MTEPSARLSTTALDPRSLSPLPTLATRAFFDVKAAGSVRPPGPGADAEAVAEMYHGMRDADGDLASRVETLARPGDHSIAAADCHELVRYAFTRCVDAHVQALQERDAPRKAWWFGSRNAYAVSYAQLALRDVEHMDAPDIADRLIEALDNGVADTDSLVRAAWNGPFPIDLHLHDPQGPFQG